MDHKYRLKRAPAMTFAANDPHVYMAIPKVGCDLSIRHRASQGLDTQETASGSKFGQSSLRGQQGSFEMSSIRHGITGRDASTDSLSGRRMPWHI